MYKFIKVTLMLVVLFSLLTCIMPAKATVEKPPDTTLQELKDTQVLHVGECNWKNVKRSCVIGRDTLTGTFYMYILDVDRNITHVVRNKAGVETVLWVRKDQYI